MKNENFEEVLVTDQQKQKKREMDGHPFVPFGCVCTLCDMATITLDGSIDHGPLDFWSNFNWQKPTGFVCKFPLLDLKLIMLRCTGFPPYLCYLCFDWPGWQYVQPKYIWPDSMSSDLASVILSPDKYHWGFISCLNIANTNLRFDLKDADMLLLHEKKLWKRNFDFP